MTDTSGVGASTQTTSTTQQTINSSLASVADNYQTFLSLLTTQLKNQDPLSPLDTNQFTQQLTQMTGVEQQLLGNQLLQTLVNEQAGMSQAANLIGKVITAPGSGSQPISGVVSAVQQVNGATLLTVGSDQVPLSSVTQISANPNNPLAALMGG
ncbi:MAG TPA: flagellar hook capping FlgD N-terminal domain-containing protein [Caulobacteraceae bacterium]|nr:flagellar hook capping FlgD N-terminal domain-containing protein [Caulobacteraceae bacterium]